MQRVRLRHHADEPVEITRLTMTTTYDDYRVVSGMRVPYRYVQSTETTGADCSRFGLVMRVPVTTIVESSLAVSVSGVSSCASAGALAIARPSAIGAVLARSAMRVVFFTVQSLCLD